MHEDAMTLAYKYGVGVYVYKILKESWKIEVLKQN